MSEQEKIRLTKEWVLTMLYNHPKTTDDLIEIGRRIMVFGWEFDEFEAILKTMEQDHTIYLNNKNQYVLTTKGNFEIKKHTLLPLFALTEDPTLLQKFIDAYRDKCDTAFLRTLSSKSLESDKILTIRRFAEQNYDKIANIISLFVTFGK